MKSKGKKLQSFSKNPRSDLIRNIIAEEVYEERLNEYGNDKKKINRDWIWGLAIFTIVVLTAVSAYFLLVYENYPKPLVAKSVEYSHSPSDFSQNKPLFQSYNLSNHKNTTDKSYDDVEANSFLAFSPELGITFAAKKEDSKYKIASLTKLMTANVAESSFTDEETLCVLEEVPLFGSADLKKDDCFERSDLIKYMITSSSNDAAAQFRLNLKTNGTSFIDKMNKTAAAVNLKNTSYSNEVGLDNSMNYSTATDVAALLHMTYINGALTDAVSTKSGTLQATNSENKYEYSTTNLLLEREDVVAGKTGFTKDAGGTLAIITQKSDWDYSIVFVLLGTKSKGSRFTEMEELIERVYLNYDL